MSRPLWQILFAMSFAAFAATRVLVPYTLVGGPVHPLLLATWGLALLASVALFVGVWLERSWPVATLVAAVGALLAAAALLQGPVLGLQPNAAAVTEASLIALLTGALCLAIRYGDPPPRPRSPRPEVRTARPPRVRSSPRPAGRERRP